MAQVDAQSPQSHKSPHSPTVSQPAESPRSSQARNLSQPPPSSWSGLRELAVDRRAEIPVGTQLVWGLRARIADGRLTAGQRLPGVRELADMFQINVNTARAIYQRLEREGLIESRQGMGTFVALTYGSRPGVGELAQEAARRARELGVDPRQLATALYMSSEAQPPIEQDRERRRELRTQIAALEAALAELQTSHPGLLPPPTSAPRMAGPRLLDSEELEQVRARLVRRLADAQVALDAQAAPAAAPAKPKQRTAPRTAPRPSTA